MRLLANQMLLLVTPSKSVISTGGRVLLPFSGRKRVHLGRVTSIIHVMTGASCRVSRKSLVVSLMVARNSQSPSRSRFRYEHLTYSLPAAAHARTRADSLILINSVRKNSFGIGAVEFAEPENVQD